MKAEASIDFVKVNEKDIYQYTIAGFFGLDQSEMINNIFDESIKKGVNKFIFDMSNLRFISSAGIGAFLGHIKEIKDRKGDIVFVNMPDKIKRVFHAFIIVKYFKIVDTEEEAIEYFKRLEEKEKTLILKTGQEKGADEKLSEQYFEERKLEGKILILEQKVSRLEDFLKLSSGKQRKYHTELNRNSERIKRLQTELGECEKQNEILLKTINEIDLKRGKAIDYIDFFREKLYELKDRCKKR